MCRKNNIVGAKSDQQVNICSFTVRSDQMWPNTQRHMIYTGLVNVPYVQFRSVDDFIPEPRYSKFVVGLQTGMEWEGGVRGPVGL